MSVIRLILIIVLISGLAGGGVFLAEQQGWVPQGTVAGLTTQISKLHPPQVLLQHSQNIHSLLSSQTQQLNQNGQVLGTSLGIERAEPPLTQKAFEYARYEYCRAVVDDYQQRINASPKPVVTPQ